MPSHSHASTTSSDGGHTHTGTTSSNGNHSHTIPIRALGSPTGNAGKLDYLSGNGMNPATTSVTGDHNHTFTTSSNGTHTHTITVSNTGEGSSHNNLQAFEVVNRWKRIA